jgi:hypothetical protein
MKKLKNYRKQIEFKIEEDNLESLVELADSDEGKELGIFKFEATGVKGVTFGRDLGVYESEGEGLPTVKDRNAHHKEFNFNFDVRISHHGSGNVEFLVAEKGAGTHFKFPLKNLTEMQAENALSEFEKRASRSYITKLLYFTAWACYRKQDDNTHRRKESYDKITANLENHFRSILNRKGEKIVNVNEKDGYKITTYEVIERGRNKGTKKPRQLSKREIEDRNNRKLKIIKAIQTAIDSQNKSELANIIGKSRPTLDRWLKSIGIKNKESFYRLIRFAEGRN